MRLLDSASRYAVQGRNGYIGLDRLRVVDGRWAVQNVVTAGTKREVAEFLHAMMVALDDAGEPAEASQPEPGEAA
jgi:hypothetical protein